MQFLQENSNQILIALVSASIVAVVGWFRKSICSYLLKKRQNEHQYLLGEYKGYFYADDGEALVIARLNLVSRKLKEIGVHIKESNTLAEYEYEGKIEIIDDILYSYLRGKQHADRALLVCKIPFNHGQRLEAMNGILSGVGPNYTPAATKVLLSRSPLKEDAIGKEFGSSVRRINVKNPPRTTMQGMSPDG